MYKELINYATKEYPFLIKHVDIRYIPHFHEEAEIVYVLDGELIITLGTNNRIAKKGDICIIPPRIIHNLYTENHSETFVMKLYPIADMNNIYLENNIFSTSDISCRKLLQYITDIMKEDEHKKSHYDLAVNINIQKIFLWILRETEYQTYDSRIRLKHIHENNFLDAVNTYLELHFLEDIGLYDIANHFSYTKSYFCRYFKSITGVTFGEYFTMFRLEKAIGCINSSPKENIISIAGKSGFANVRSFNDAFKKYYHCTPREYRKLAQNM